MRVSAPTYIYMYRHDSSPGPVIKSVKGSNWVGQYGVYGNPCYLVSRLPTPTPPKGKTARWVKASLQLTDEWNEGARYGQVLSFLAFKVKVINTVNINPLLVELHKNRYRIYLQMASNCHHPRSPHVRGREGITPALAVPVRRPCPSVIHASRDNSPPALQTWLWTQ
jgi:hypothetical protein